MSGHEPLGDPTSLVRGEVAALLGLLNSQGEEARVVGGAVRNALLRLPVDELDIATTAVPDEVVRRVEGTGWKRIQLGSNKVQTDSLRFSSASTALKGRCSRRRGSCPTSIN